MPEVVRDDDLKPTADFLSMDLEEFYGHLPTCESVVSEDNPTSLPQLDEDRNLPFEPFTEEELQKLMEDMDFVSITTKVTFTPVQLDDEVTAIIESQ